MRICSLLPSATEIIAQLGLIDSLVGISEECRWPPEVVGKPVVTAARIEPSFLTSLHLASPRASANSPTFSTPKQPPTRDSRRSRSVNDNAATSQGIASSPTVSASRTRHLATPRSAFVVWGPIDGCDLSPAWFHPCRHACSRKGAGSACHLDRGHDSAFRDQHRQAPGCRPQRWRRRRCSRSLHGPTHVWFRQRPGGVWRAMNASTRSQASADASANSSCRRSKKLWGAPS